MFSLYKAVTQKFLYSLTRNFFGNTVHNYSQKVSQNAAKNFGTGGNTSSMRVAVIGAAGKVGQSVSLMLKQSPLIDELCIHDLKNVSGLGLELNHIDTKCKVFAYSGKDGLPQALQRAKVVVILASAPDADFLPLEKMWIPNSIIVKEIAEEIGKSSPKAFVAIATNPVNSLVPVASEIFKRCGCYNSNTLFGITTLDTVRANTFAAEVQGLEPECVIVPVVGGHSPDTMVPVLSQAKPCAEFTNEELESITMSVRKAQESVLKLKPAESAPLSAAFATARFVISLVKAIQGYPDVVESAYVNSKAHPQLKYLSTPLLLGPGGVMKNMGIPKMSDFEQCLFDNMIPTLLGDIKKGEKFICGESPTPCDPCDPSYRAPKCPHNWCEMRS